MLQTAKRCIGILLAVMMVLTCVWSAFTVQAATDVLFEDNFSSTALSGWSAANVGSVSGGKYTIDGTGVNAITAVGAGENVAILADVEIQRTGNQAGNYASGTASLAFLASADLSAGYEFGLGVNKDGSTYAMVCKTGKEEKILFQRAINIPGVEGGKIKQKTPYALKVIVYGKEVTCYINNKPFYSFEVATATGYVGVSSWYAKSGFDNVAVRRAGEKKLEKIELQNTPAEITVAGFFEFDILATYGGVYGQDVISSEEDGVTVSGLDGTTGTKTLTVTYGGKSAKCTTKVVKAVPRVLLTDDFSTDKGDWAGDTNTTGLTPSKIEITGGKVVGKMPKTTLDSPYTMGFIYQKTKTLFTDIYYSISVDAMITGDSTTETFRNGIAILRFVNSAGEYQFRANSNGSAQIYYNGKILSTASCSDDIALNKNFNMRVDVMGNIAVCYINNKEVLSCSFSAKDATAQLALSIYNGSAQFDNLVIKKLEGKSKWSIKSMQTVDSSGTPTSSFAGRSFNPAKYALKVNYFDGSSFMIPITESMIDGYDPSVKSTQTIRFNYGAKSVKFSVTYKDYLYHNDFSGGINLSESAGAGIVPTIKGGVLTLTYTKPANNATVSKTMGVPEGVSEYSNYSVSADVALLDGNTAKTQYAGLVLRSGAKTSYSYRLIYNTTGMVYLYLYHNVGAGNVLIRQWSTAELLATYEDATNVTISINQFYNLKVEIIGNMLYCYFNNTLLDIIVDEDPNYAEGPGNVGFVAINTSAAFDNIYVYPLEERTPTGISVSGDIVKDGVLQAYQGYEIEPETVTLNVNYSDGFKSSQPLWSDYIVESYDPSVLGEQTITLSYKGVTSKVRVNVYERPEYIAAFVEKVKAFKKGSLTAADAAAVNEMIRYFGTLSGYEIAHLEQDVYKTYTDLVAEMDKLSSETLKDAEQLLYADFSKQPEEFEDWYFESISGVASVRNGSFVNEQKKRSVSGQTLMYSKSSYGTILSAEADIMLLYPATYAALVVYGSESTYYHARVTNKPVDENGNPVMTLQLYKYSGGSQLNLGSIYPILKGVTIEEGKWNNLRMDLNNGLISVYLDDVMMIQYDDSQSTDYIVDGYVGLRNSEQDAKYDNFRAYGIKKEAPQTEYVKQIEPTEYKDDFEDETVGKDPSHWTENSDRNHWKVMNKGGSKVYGTAKQTQAFSWLHAFEIDPVYTAKLMATSGTGRVGFITRLVNEEAHLDIGYDFAQKKWYFASNGSEDVDVQTFYAEKSTAFALGEWHSVEVTLDDDKLTVKCDGETVLSHEKVLYASFGRMGVFAENSDLYIDDVKITSKNGAIFNDGVVEFTLNTEEYLNTMEIEDITEDVLVAAYGGKKYVSTDGGKTFMTAADYGKYTNLPDNGYPSYLDLDNGKWIAIADATKVYISNDDMTTWEQIALVLPEEERYDPTSGKELPIIHTSSLTKVTMPNGVTRIFLPIAIRNPDAAGNILGHYVRFFYSDDGGYTWTESENDSRDLIPFYNNSQSTTYAEGKIIQCSDGAVRYYQTRNKTGSTIYLESKDYGKTWTEFGKIPYMQAPVGSFGIEEDPYNPGTYYMAWVNCFPTALGAILPRTRLSLARTTDGKNFEFLTDVFRTSDFDAEYNDIRQIVDPSVCVTKDYVHVTYSVAAKYANSAHNALRIRYCRLEKDNLSAHAWNDATISDTTAPEKIEVGKLPQTKFGYADLFNTTGMEIKVTALNGAVTTETPKEYFLVDGEPNMFKLGKQTVRMMSKYYMFLEYEIEIVPNYDLIWTIKGRGSIDPDPDAFNRMMEGATQAFTLKPAKGYKVSYVTVNGKDMKISKNTFTITDVQENQEITVSFVKKTIVDYIGWIILGAVVVAGIAIGVVLLVTKRKKKPAADDAMEDISSSSTPPTDEN